MGNKVLVCDDEQEILDIVKLILEDEGLDVVAVKIALKWKSWLHRKGRNCW